ncbi:YDG domain-containing protein, partial [Flagellimonas marinaquae]|uniref:YDG domain-containing protein n=1 Tax=Flagellimonas marinaquae TaxID=254955 RepID=UPI0013DF1ECA
MKVRFLLISFFALVGSLTAQTLTVSSSGETGTSGTNWSITGTTLTVTGTVNIQASVIETALASGNLLIEGNTGNFGVTVSEAISVGSGSGDLTIGAVGNTGAATLNAAVSTRGDIIVNVGTFSLNDGINLSTATASDITLSILGDFGTIGTTRRNISSAGGNITIHADSDANGSGQLDLDYLTIDPGAGNIIIRGETFYWSIAADAEKPYINGTGSFIIEPSDAAFGGTLETTYLRIDQDGNGLSGVTLGKSGNTALININTSLTVAGSVSVYGSAIGITADVTTDGDFLVRSTTHIDQSGTSTTTTNGGNVIYWSGANDQSYIRSGTLITNGGHVFMGGDWETAGTRTWNGLTVGAGYAASSAFPAAALRGNIDTRVTANPSTGGDVLIAGESGVTSYGDVAAENANRTITTGNGDITLMPLSEVLQTNGTFVMILETTGKISVAPISGGSFWTGRNPAFTYSGSFSSGTFTGSSALAGVQIPNFASIGGWELGTYSGTGEAGDSPYVDGNIKNMTIDAAFTLAGPISVYGDAVYVKQSLETSASGAAIRLKGNGPGTGFDEGWVIMDVNTNLTTAGGDIILWANAANRNSGSANNEIALRGTNILTSNGGKIVLAGGLDDGSNGGTANDGIPDGYAYRGGANWSAVDFNNNVQLLSGNGDVIIRGHSNPSGVAGSFNGGLRGFGVETDNGFVINSGTGTINIKGLSNSDHAVWFDDGNVAITSASTATDAIVIDGESTINFSGFGVGFNAGSAASLIQTTGASDGNITINSRSNGASNSIWLGNEDPNSTLQILSNTGDISISSSDVLYIANQNLYLGNRKDATPVQGITPVATAASGNITIQFNGLNFQATHGIGLGTTGALVLEPYSNSFTNALSWPINNFNVASGLTGLRLGKEGNTANITVSTAQTIAGPITLYGGSLAINGDLNAISFSGYGSRATVNSNITATSGDILIDADRGSQFSFDGSGVLIADNVRLEANSGNINISGRGGDNNTGSQKGVKISDGVELSTTSGTITISGVGGASSGTDNHGVDLGGSTTTASITTTGGDITITGVGAGTGSSSRNDGISTNKVNISSGAGSITLDGKAHEVSGSITSSSESIAFDGESVFGHATNQSGSITFIGDVFWIPSSGTNRQALTSGAVVFESESASFRSSFTYRLFDLNANTSSLRLGKSTNTSDVTIDSDITTAGPITLYGANLALNNALTATGADINLHASGAVTQSAALTSNGLGLHGTGTFTLQNAANNIATLAGGIAGARLGNIAYRDADALEIGSVNPNGIFSSGTILIETENGDITLSEDLNTTSGSTDAIIVNAGRASAAGTTTGGNILVSGSPTLSYGSGGIAKLFSGVEGSSTGLSALADETRTGFDETSSITPALAGDNTYAIYRVEPGAGDLIIVASGGDALNSTWAFSNGVLSTIGSPANVNAADVEAYLASGDLRIEAKTVSIEADITSTTANTLTLKTLDHIAANSGTTITTNGGSVVLWSSAEGSTAGYIRAANIITNGGHVWMGGSVAAAGTATWNGLTVGDGSTIRSGHAIELIGDITTDGGDVLLAARSTSGTHSDIAAVSANRTLNTGSGDVALLSEFSSFFTGTTYRINITSTGILSFAPLSGRDYNLSNLTISGSTSAGNFTGTEDLNGIVINDIANVTGLVFGNYLGTGVSGDTDYTYSNTTDTDVNPEFSIAGLIAVYGADIYLKHNLTSTGAGADINIIASGSILSTTRSKTISTNGGDVLFASDSDGNGAGTIRSSESTFTLAIDTRAIVEGVKSTGLTGGGNITFGGGDMTGSGYASGFSSSRAEGIRIDRGFTAQSGGGDVTMRGQSWSGAVSAGLGAWGLGFWSGTVNIDAGAGKVYLEGVSRVQDNVNSYKQGFVTHRQTEIYSAYEGSDAITIIGKQNTTSPSFNIGLDFGGNDGVNPSRPLKIVATGQGGGITLEGLGNNSAVVIRDATDLVTNGGPITLIGAPGTGNAGGRLDIANPSNVWLGSRSGQYNDIVAGDLTVRFNTYSWSGRPNIAVTGEVLWEPFSDSFGQSVNTNVFNWNQNSQTMTGLTIGKEGNTATFTQSTADFTVNGPISVYGGNLAFNAALTATSSDINLHASGAVTQTAALTANGLGLHGAGTFTLTNTSNNVVTIAGGDNTDKLGSLSYVDASGGLEIGSVNPDGIYSTGPILIETLDGDITLSENLSAEDGSTDAIILNAGKSTDVGTSTGGDIKVSGTPTITMGSGGIVKLFSGSESGSNGLSDLVGSSNIKVGFDETSDLSGEGLVADNAYAIYRAQGGPEAPGNVSAAALDGEVFISFTEVVDNENPITNYEYTLDGGDTWTAFDPAVTTSPVSITGLTNGTEYSIQIRAVNSNGSGTASSTVTVTPNIINLSTLGGLTIAASGGDAENTTWVYRNNVIRPISSEAVIISVADVTAKMELDNLSIAASAITVQDGISYSTDSASLTLEASGTITVGGAIGILGSLNLNGNAISVNNNLDISLGGTGSNIVLKALSNITVVSSASITTAGGSLVIWADTDGSGDGNVKLSSTITTNGGGVWIGGSYLTNGSGTTSWTPYTSGSPITVGAGYAVSDGSSYGVSLDQNASIQTSGGNISIYGYGDQYFSIPGNFYAGGLTIDGSQIISSGGDISLEGVGLFTGTLNAAADYLTGLLIHSGAIINSAAGSVTMVGTLPNSDLDYASAVWIGSSPGRVVNGDVTILSTSGDISITGNTQNSIARNQYKDGIRLQTTGNSGDDIQISSTSGNITLNGTAGRSGETRVNVGLRINSNDVDSKIAITSQSGAIVLKGVNRGVEGANQVAIEFNAGNAADQIKIGYDGSNPYSGDILIQGNSIKQTLAAATSGTMSFQTTGELVIEPVDDAFTVLNLAGTDGNLVFDNNWNFGNSLSGFTLGKATNTKNLTIGSSLNVAGPIRIYGGNLALNAAVSATDGAAEPTLSDINLHATGTVTQTAALTADGLGLHGVGTFTLTNTGNNVVTLAGGESAAKLGSLSFVDAADGLEIGTVNPTGIFATGPVLIETLDGDITLSQSILTDDTSTDAIILNAGKNTAAGTTTGGDIVVSGSPTLTTGSGGIAKLFSGSDANSTGLTTLVGGNTNVRTQVDETTTTFSPVLSSNNAYALYRMNSVPQEINKIAGDYTAPFLGSTVIPAPTVFVTDSFGYPYAGQEVTFEIGDGGGTFNKVVLANVSDNLAPGGSTINALDWKGIVFTTGSEDLDVRSIALRFTADGSSYPYDVDVAVSFYDLSAGLPNTELATTGVQTVNLTGHGMWEEFLLSSDLTLSANTSYAMIVQGSGASSVKWSNTSDTPERNPQGFEGYVYEETLSSADGGSTWSIIPAAKNFFQLAVTDGSDLTSVTVETDATGRAGLGRWNLGGGANPETITATATGLTNSPLTFSATETLTVDSIADQTYTGSAIEPSVVVKDGATTLTEGTDYTLSYSNNTDQGTATVTITLTGSYSGSKQVTFTISGESLAGFSVEAVADQTYTGSVIEPSVVISDDDSNTLVEGTDYTLSYADNTDVGTATITITGAGTYIGTQDVTFDITAKELTITGITGNNKTYDGTTDATVTGEGSESLNGVIGSDAVTLGGTPVFTFADANVADGISITTTGYTLTGADSGNYTLTQPTLSANITAATLTITGLTGDNKTYDGT